MAQWFWTMEDEAGAPVQVSEEYADQRFDAKAEAEAWVGEVFADLLDEGVDRVTLHEGERRDYSMSLHAG